MAPKAKDKTGSHVPRSPARYSDTDDQFDRPSTKSPVNTPELKEKEPMVHDSPTLENDFDFSSYPTEPLPLISPEIDDSGREVLVVQQKALDLLRRILVPVAVLAVSGLYRSGKSSLLNWLCDPNINSDLFEFTDDAIPSSAALSSTTTSTDGFAVGATVQRCTRGIWLWGRPRPVKLQDGTLVALIVMDTEGLGGMDAGAAYDARIFSLAALLCSTMLYNSLGTIDEKAISSLSFVADLARNIRLTPDDDGGDGHQLNQNELLDLGHLFPSFVWVLRDFALVLVDDEDETIDSSQYLNQCLSPQHGFDAGVTERNKIRKALTAFFQNRTCCTLVRPLHDEDLLQQVNLVEWEHFRPEFIENFRTLQSTLLQILKPKFTAPPKNSGASPRPMNGQMYATLIGEYVRAVNSEGAPVVATAWEQVTANECLDAAATAIAAHKQFLASLQLPMDASAAADKHASVLYLAILGFDERAEGAHAAKERARLQNSMSLAYREWCVMNESSSATHCRQCIQQLYQASPLAVFEEGTQEEEEASLSFKRGLTMQDLAPADMIEAIKACWGEIITEYHKQAVGPKSDSELLECLASKWECLAKKAILLLEGRSAKETDHSETALLEARRLVAQMKTENEIRESEVASSSGAATQSRLDLERTKEALQSAQTNEIRLKQSLKGEVEKRRILEKEVEAASEESSRLQQQLDTLKASTTVLEAEKQHLQDQLEAEPPFEPKDPSCCVVQ